MPNPRVQEVRLLYRGTGHKHKSWSPGMVTRAKPPTISTESINFAAQHSAKTKQAWRYPGGNITRAPSKTLGGTVYVDPKDPEMPRRKQESNFFITINSNKDASKLGPDLTQSAFSRMEKMLVRLSDERVLAQYLKFGPKSPEYEADKYTDVINAVDWKAAVETGDAMHRVHAHIWLTISHYSQIQINVHMLMHLARSFYNEGLSVRGGDKLLAIGKRPYVHVKLLPQGDWTSVMRQYIHKGMTHV